MKYFGSLFIVIILSTFISCRQSLHRVSRVQIGTVINLAIDGDPSVAAVAAQKAFEEIERVEKVFSPYKKNSDIGRINAAASGTPVSVSQETFLLIKRSQSISKATSGTFDISFAGIAHLWHFNDKKFTPPSRSQVSKYLTRVNFRNVRLDNRAKSVSLNYPGMKIGLGAIAKGYAIERAVAKLKENGVESAIVDAGGDVQVLGSKKGVPWKTGLIHPRTKEILLGIDMSHMDAVATSGDYERFAEYKGKRYHHILDPRTGFPANIFASVSVISKDPVLSDSLATAFFVLGLNGTKAYLKRNPTIGVVLVDLDLKIYISKNLKEKIQLFKKEKVVWL